MSHSNYSSADVVRRGEEIYERDLRDKVEPQHNGKFMVLDIDTGAYEIDVDEVAAIQRAMARNPAGMRYIKRIGYSAAHRLGGRFITKRR